MYFRYSGRILNQESIFQHRETPQMVKKRQKTPKNSIFRLSQKMSLRTEIFQNRRSPSSGEIFDSNLFVGLTNISTCRKHDFSTVGRFFLPPAEAFSPGHFSASPLKAAKIKFFRHNLKAG